MVGVYGRDIQGASHEQAQRPQPERMVQMDDIRLERPNPFANPPEENIGQPEFPLLAHGQ